MNTPSHPLRLALALLVPGATAFAAAAPSPTRPPGTKPNFIIILTDDQGYGDLGVFGSKTIRTPRLDRMAGEGLRLTSCYSAPLCGPARAALLTGSYAPRVMRLWSLPPGEITIAELLKPAGYATACIGKWDLSRRSNLEGRVPNDQGFDYYFGPLGANDGGRVKLYRNRSEIGDTTDMGSLTRTYTDEALNYIQSHRDGPFFLYLAHTMPHVKIGASDQFRGKSAAGLYGDTVEEIDWNVGRILDALREHGIERNTLVVFLSDNGPWCLMREHGAGSAGPLRGSKRSAYEGGMRVPGIVWSPGLVPGGRVSDGIVSSTDFFATFAYLAGVRVPDDRVLDSLDQSPLFTGERTVSSRETLLYYTYHGVGLADPVLSAIRHGRWKFMTPAAPRHAPELFDLDADIGETRNLAFDHPGIVRQFIAIAAHAHADIGDREAVGRNSRVTTAEIESLRHHREELQQRRPIAAEKSK
ncbi:MAG: N-acetylgalactosamine-6-sulfatase [Opitutus sp.]|nr:N-acetylgalactosamine-6-sulfatase [Opitutus sp.]